MIDYYFKENSKSTLIRIPEFKKGCWIHVSNPSKDEINFLTKKFKISEANLIDGLDIHENPRFEIEDKKTYIYLTAPTNKIQHEHDSSFLVVSAKDYFMTISKYSLEVFEKILAPRNKFTKFDNSTNMMKILFFLSRLFETSVHKILKNTKANKADLSRLRNKDIERLIHDEDKLNNYIASMGSTISTYGKILRDPFLKFLRKDEVILEDLIIDLNETLNLCKQTLKTISNMRTYYSTKLSNDLNNTVKILTLATIFISIPTLISSIYGMNINLPMQNSGSIMYILLALAIGICGIFTIFLRRKKVF